MPLNDDDVREILRIIDESELDELSIETEGFSLHVRKAGAADAGPADAGPAAARSEAVLSRTASERAPEIPDGAAASQSAESNGLETVLSPMLGTFYRAEAPGAEPFVEVGAAVDPETTVCIIEVMKMMNSVPAGVSGTIAEVVPENGQLVEYGEPLFRVKPAG
jgi:acetyl-CoA carboxylase biotin carboxyl carrier protein